MGRLAHTTSHQIFATSNPGETEKLLGCGRTRCPPSLPVSPGPGKRDIPEWILHQHRVRQHLRGLCLGRAQVKGKAGEGSLSSAPSPGNTRRLLPPGPAGHIPVIQSLPCGASKPFGDGRHPWMSHRKPFAFPSANLSSNPSPTSLPAPSTPSTPGTSPSQVPAQTPASDARAAVSGGSTWVSSRSNPDFSLRGVWGCCFFKPSAKAQGFGLCFKSKSGILLPQGSG